MRREGAIIMIDVACVRSWSNALLNCFNHMTTFTPPTNSITSALGVATIEGGN